MTYDELVEKKDFLQSLFKHPGWVYFEELLDAQIVARRLSIFNLNIHSLDDSFEITRQQAEISGLSLAKQLPRYQLESIKSDIAVLLEAERRAEEEGTNNG